MLVMSDRAVSFPASGDALDLLLSRRSVAPGLLRAPAPEGRDLDEILDAGLRAPDHGRLRPWRFLLVRGAARESLGEVFAKALESRDPTATQALLERERSRSLMAPLLIAVGARIQPDHPVPEVEQLLSAGAAAMNMLNAIHALGYGGIWLTGARCYDPMICQALGFHEPDRLVGFLYVGTPGEAAPSANRPDRKDHVSEWIGPVE